MLHNRTEATSNSTSSFFLCQHLHRPNYFGWLGVQTPAEAENSIDGWHSQAPFNQRYVSPFESGNFRQFFLGDASIPPESGERQPDDAFHFLRFIRQIQAVSLSG